MQRFDVKAAARRLAQKDLELEHRIDERFERAWKDFAAIVAMIVSDYALEQVYQWGSLLNRRNFRDYSDIDIAVAGEIGAEGFFEMYGKAMALTDFPIDIVELAAVRPERAESIRRRGRLVYDRASIYYRPQG
jgi:predicted nucleotidyltransferase